MNKRPSGFVKLIPPTIALLVFGFADVAHSQKAAAESAKGTLVVTDIRGNGIPFTTVILNNGSARVTNEQGRIFLGKSVKDSIRLFVRRIGFDAFDGKLGPASDGSYAIKLTGNSQKLAAVEVSGKRETSALERTGYYQRMQDSQLGRYNGEYYTPEALDARPAMKTSQVLQNSRFARVEYNAGLAVIRGRGGCVMSIVIDGHRINGVFRGSSAAMVARSANALTIDDLVSSGEIAAIEIYPHAGNAPPAIQPLTGDGSCGIVAIWTGGR